MTTYLAIVERGRTGIYETLKETFEAGDHIADVTVIWDRRQADRRVRRALPPAQQRRGEHAGIPPRVGQRWGAC